MLNKPKHSQFGGIERRKHERFRKSFILSYHLESDPHKKMEITQLKNISLGGMCFVTGQNFASTTKLVIEMKTPYLAGTAFLNGTVLGANEKMKGKIYETRVKFTPPFDTESEILLKRLIDFFTEAKDQSYE